MVRAGLLAFLLAAAAVACAGARAANPISIENSLPGTPSWQMPAATGPAIEGYTSETSAAPGETIHFHVSTQPAEWYRIEIYRLGWYGGDGGRLLACLPSCTFSRLGSPQPVPAPDSLTGVVSAGWPVTDEQAVPASWVSGYYLAKLVLASGDQRGSAVDVVFVVREPAARHSAIVVQVPVNTWEAYNNWGGKSLYNFNSRDGVPATHVSFDRPYAPANQSPFVWEYQLVRFLEREGYDVSYQTDADTERSPDELKRHRLVMVAGHDEYWTKGMRDAFERARDSGTNLAFMGANAAYWQVRYENDGRTLVGYKSSDDPIADPSLKTMLFRALVPPRYECALMGVQHQGGLRRSTDGPVDYVVNPAAAGDPWFAGTGLTASSVLTDLVGREWDSIPASLPVECAKAGLTVLFHHEGAPANADAVRYAAPSGARVFSSGSLQFSWGLDDWDTRSLGHTSQADSRLQQFMRNALDDLTRPARPLAVSGVPSSNTVAVTVVARSDPRVRAYVVLRHRGRQPFRPGDPGVTKVCETLGPCVDRGLAPGPYRYEAMAVDPWGASSVAATRPVIVR